MGNEPIEEVETLVEKAKRYANGVKLLHESDPYWTPENLAFKAFIDGAKWTEQMILFTLKIAREESK